MSGKNSLRPGDPGWGVRTCACGNRKHAASKRCNECYRGEQTAVARNPHSLWGESIVTFRERSTGQLATRHCVGSGVLAQLNDGRCQLPDGDWDVQSRSTPRTILNDLRRQPNSKGATT